jgi:hypothetical protein
MALSTPQTNNILIKFTKEINREYVRQNLFSPYMGEDMSAIIRLRRELTEAGNQMNIPLVAALQGTAIGSGTLVGNEEKIDDYGMRLWIDYARNAVVSSKSARRKDSAMVFDEARSLLSDWGKSLQRDEIVGALYALPSESAPANIDTSAGQRVNGILFQSSTAAQKNTWQTDNADRVVFGQLKSNLQAGFPARSPSSTRPMTSATEPTCGCSSALPRRPRQNCGPTRSRTAASTLSPSTGLAPSAI